MVFRPVTGFPLFDQPLPCRPLATPNSSSSPPLTPALSILPGSLGCLLLSLPQTPASSRWVYQGSLAPPTEAGLLPPTQQHEFWSWKLSSDPLPPLSPERVSVSSSSAYLQCCFSWVSGFSPIHPLSFMRTHTDTHTHTHTHVHSCTEQLELEP